MKKILSIVTSWLSNHWRGLVLTIFVATITAMSVSLGLNSTVPGQNQIETESLATIKSDFRPWARAVNAPYTIPAHLLGDIIGNPLHAARMISVAYGLLATVLLFVIIKLWFNVRAATIGVLIFATSSWLLHITHMAAPLILLVVGPIIIIAPFAWILKTKNHTGLAFLLVMASLAFAAYIPYMPWLIAIVLVLLVIFERKLVKRFKTWQIAATAIAYGLVLTPLLISLVQHPGQIYELFGIPKNLPSIQIYFDQLAYTISMLFFRSAPFPALHLGRLPMLDIFSAAMFAMGIYHFSARLNCRRSMIILTSFVTMILLVPLAPVYQLSSTVLLPLVYVFVISGIVELLNQWFSYFPRNPWARNFGVAILAIAIGFSCFYHLERYYIAWANAPETKSVYVVKSIE